MNGLTLDQIEMTDIRRRWTLPGLRGRARRDIRVEFDGGRYVFYNVGNPAPYARMTRQQACLALAGFVPRRLPNREKEELDELLTDILDRGQMRLF